MELLTWAAGLVLGVIGGALGTWVALRIRLERMDARHLALEMQLTAKIDDIDRRGMTTLRIVASVARKVGADVRWDDAFLRFLSEDSPKSGGS